ncbi:TIGR02147 family protein [Bdellovibrio sp.]|uniref:TIGR02147 family protein n=1 Tax=Bdellovibrio sp. TaxID=28201 RepID=UPI0039E55C2D
MSHEILKKIISEKKQLNPRLSLRSIAAKMDIPSGRLSEILNGKRSLSDYYLDKICSALKLPPQTVALLRKNNGSSNQKIKKNSYGSFLTDNQIEGLTDWKPYAFMSFLQTTAYLSIAKDHPTKALQVEHLAKKMNFSSNEISSLISLLLAHNLIHWVSDRWLPTYENATTGYDIPNEFIQNSHVRDLDLAKKRLPSVNLSRRDFSSITIAIDPKDMTKAKKMIRNFRREFAETLEKGSKKEVYQISIQFFPIFEKGD